MSVVCGVSPVCGLCIICLWLCVLIDMLGLGHDKLTWELALACMLFVRVQMEVWLKAQLPHTAEDQSMLIVNSLRISTRGLAGGSISLSATERVMDLLSDMVPGSEVAHCWRLYKFLDVRGSDARLCTGAVVEGGRQLAPYPALAWDWKSVKSYKWQTTQHIIFLELLAFLNYLRMISGRPNTHAYRIFTYWTLGSVVASSPRAVQAVWC